uniref:Uncharacterized protein n=1 Tax=Anguilla anguilla TaxID=7936 RepID=A0A0E9XNK9_ANGAN
MYSFSIVAQGNVCAYEASTERHQTNANC